MNTSFFSLQKGFNMAFLRLQVWFDPAQTGSPYETSTPRTSKKHKQKYPFFSKRLSIRM